jgi:hypothetical protein
LGAGIAGAGIGSGVLIGSGVESSPVFSVSMWSPRGFNVDHDSGNCNTVKEKHLNLSLCEAWRKQRVRVLGLACDR